MEHKDFAASALLLMLSLCFSATLAGTLPRPVSAATPRYKALLVGLDYGLSSANWTRNATAMQAALLTWSCWRSPTGTIKLITGQASNKDIVGNLSAMNISANDYFIFYYSGHANRYNGYERSPALTPVDEALYTTTIRPNSPRSLKDNDFTSCLNQTSPNNYTNADKIIVLDCCYAGGFWNGNDLGGGGDLERLPRVALLSSANETTISPESSEFTNYLVQGMTKTPPLFGKAPADTNKDGVVTAKEWFDYAASRVTPGPIYGFRKQTEEEPLENETTLNEQTWTYNSPQAVDTDGTLNSMVSSEEFVGGTLILPDVLILLAPYIGLASTILAAASVTTIYVRRVKRREEKQ